MLYLNQILSKLFSHKLIHYIGSMISAKSTQKALQSKKASEEINQEEYLKCIQISEQIHSALYKYSERRLIKLSLNKEFKEVIAKHAELWNADNMNRVGKYFYSKIIQIFS